jgi:hypothetical protein
LWRDLPAGLETEIEQNQAKNVAPRQVALGRKGSYICLWSNDRWSYSLNGNFEGLILKFNDYKKKDTVIAFAALDPYETDNWILVDEDGLISTNLKNFTSYNLEKVQEMSVGYMQRRVRKTGETFTNQFSLNGRPGKPITITKDTEYDKPPATAGSALLDPLRGMQLQLANGPAWKPSLLAAGAIGGTTALVAHYLKMPALPVMPAAAVSGMMAGIYVHGYFSGVQLTKGNISAA